MAHARPAFCPFVELTRRGFVSALCLGWAGRARAGERSSLSELWRRFPSLEAAIPAVSLGTFPTPVEHAERLGRELGVELWIKRDDLSSRYGGGKTRKLECLLAAARRAGHGRVATFGGFGSNHCVATAYHASKLGLETELYVLAERKSEHAQKNLRAMLAWAADVQIAGSLGDALRRARRKNRPAPFVLPVGGSSALGSVPFVAAAFELDAQVRAGLLPRPDVIVMAAGTMGSAAGVALGASALGWSTEVRAVRTASPGTSSLAALGRLLRETRALLHGTAPAFPASGATNVELDGRELGRGYAEPTARARRMKDLAAEHAGLDLELTYTAKALGSVERSAKELRGQRVLFWHSAGPAPELRTDIAVPAAFRAFLR